MTTLTSFDDFSSQADPATVQIRALFYFLRVGDLSLEDWSVVRTHYHLTRFVALCALEIGRAHV